MKYQFVFSLIFALLGSPSADAQPSKLNEPLKGDIRFTTESESGCNDRYCTFYVRGTITNDTAREAQDFLVANKNKYLTVHFDSLGGDVRAALDLGRVIRKYVATTYLGAGDCASACVLSFVGGADRTTASKAPRFGIHTPYSIDTRNITYENADNRFKTTSKLVAQYLQDMNIPSSLFDEMLRYPAESMHVMTSEELSRYRVLGMDPAEQDRRDSNLARLYGVDKQTYLSRKQLTKIECDRHSIDNPTKDSFLKHILCRDRIMYAK